MQPEHALDDWRQWDAGMGSRPKILGSLSGGRSNRNFLLDTGIGRLVLRINGADSVLPGADRSFEAGIWLAASRQGISPPLVFADDRKRYLVSTYIESRLPASSRTDAAVMDMAFGLLEKCHQLDASASIIDYASHIEHYWQMIEAGPRPPGPDLERQRNPMGSLLASLVNSDTPTGLCHHDPVFENFVGTPDRLYLIDWEYAATGLQIMDYAALATEWQMDTKVVARKTGVDPEQLQTALSIYQYLCSLWQAAT